MRYIRVLLSQNLQQDAVLIAMLGCAVESGVIAIAQNPIILRVTARNLVRRKVYGWHVEAIKVGCASRTTQDISPRRHEVHEEKPKKNFTVLRVLHGL